MSAPHNDRAHARFSPSQMGRIIACPGSVRLAEKAPPQLASEHALRGTAAHEVLELALREEISPSTAYSRLRTARNLVSTDVFVDLDSDDLRAVSVACEFVRDLLEYHDDAVAEYEARVEPYTPAAPGEGSGTADVLISVPSENLLYVIDYKHGAGVNVEAKSNTQMLQYAAGALRSDLGRGVRTVVMAIVQPRIERHEPIKIAVVSREQVERYEKTLDRTIRIALAPDAELAPGKSQCRFCPAAGLPCPALQNKSLAALGVTASRLRGRVTLNDPTTANLDEIVAILDNAAVIQRWIDAAKKAALDHARLGYKVPGKKLVRAPGRRHWFGKTEDVAARIAELLDAPDANAVMEKKLPSLLAVETLIVDKLSTEQLMPLREARQRARAAMAELTEVQRGSWRSLRLVDETEPGEPVPATVLGNLNLRSMTNANDVDE